MARAGRSRRLPPGKAADDAACRRNRRAGLSRRREPLDYREYLPSPNLADHIERIWTLKNLDSSGPGPVERVLPDGRFELVLHLGDRFHRVEAGGATRQPRAFLVGQMTRPMRIQAEGRVDVLGVRFKPGGLSPFVRQDLAQLTGFAPTLEELWGREGRELIERTASRSGEARRIEQVEGQLSRLLAGGGRKDPSIDAMTETILTAAGKVRVAWLAETSGLSVRQLERRFRARVGIGPKVLMRIARFQAAVAAATSAQGKADWALLAVDCGYFDQSHLIGEFKLFSGVTPAAWAAQAHRLSDLFTAELPPRNPIEDH